MRRVIKLIGIALGAAALLGTDIATGQAAGQPAAGAQAAPAQTTTPDQANAPIAPVNTPASGTQTVPQAIGQERLMQEQQPSRLPVPDAEVMTNEPGAGAPIAEENRTLLFELGNVRISAGPVVIPFPDTRTDDGTQNIAVPSLVIRFPWTAP